MTARFFAYMLSQSGAPAGGAELPADVTGLNGILVQFPSE